MIESIAHCSAGLALSTGLGDVNSASVFLYIKASRPKH